MATKITAIIMANTKTTTQTSGARCGTAVLGIALILFALLNLSRTITPIANSNDLLDEQFKKAQAMPLALQEALFKDLYDGQIANLAHNPSDPYGWARLAYLRLIASKDESAAFSYLFMSDFVSPYEALQLPERAVMWHRFHNAENSEQQAYQDVLWQKAYRMNSDKTWDIAVRNSLAKDVEASFKKTNPVFYGEWKDREAKLH